ncbi:hypothetical protein TrVFT333_010489 [Trichoderma virens FT-333]|nr:hypothetical protein TrVFT333_010489 [Trichoderma virens FT-333]
MAVQTKSSTYVNLVNMTATQTSDPISGTIVPVQAAMKSYSMVKANTELGDTFHAAGSGLHLIYEALSSVKSRLPPEISNASLKLLDSCKAGATSSEAVFKEVSQAPSDTRLQSYTAFIKEGADPI